jgi:RNA polymerase sigma-70 factor (ECF subfamily)
VARDRDEKDFSELYDRHAPLVFGLACRILGRNEEAEDLLQEVFMSIWERAASYDSSRGPVVAWISVMARSRCIDRLRRRSLRQGREISIYSPDGEGDALLALPEPGVSTLDSLGAAEQKAAVSRALDALPPLQRTVLDAAYFEGLTQQEIADKLGEPLGTVKTRMRLGLMKLAELLSAREVSQ